MIKEKKAKLDSRIMYVSSSKEKKNNIEAKYKSKKKRAIRQASTGLGRPRLSRVDLDGSRTDFKQLSYLYILVYIFIFQSVKLYKVSPFKLIPRAIYLVYEEIAEIIQKITKWHIKSIFGGLI